MQGLISTFHKLKYQSHSADYNSPNHHKAGKTKAHPLPLFIYLAYSLSLFPPQSNLPMPDGYSSEPAVVGHACSEYFPIPKHRYGSRITQYIQITFTHRSAKATVWLMLVIFPIKGTVQVIGQPPTLRTFRSVIKNTSVCCPLLRLST